MADFESFQNDHLFLLIGANPLPNYVAARLLSRPGGYLHLLAAQHESGLGGTIHLAENIQRQLPDRNSRIIGLTDVSDARQIERQVTQSVQGLRISVGSRVGLNYTGGTKAMSVHTHETLQSWCADRNLTYQFSYLDPRQLAFRFASGLKEPIKPEDCKLPLKELVALHGWEVTSADSNPILTELSHRLAHDLGSDPNRYQEWRQWCDWNIRTWYKSSQWHEADWPGFKASDQSPALVSWIEASRENKEAIELLLQWVQSTSRKERKRELALVKPHPILSQAETLADFLTELEPASEWPDTNKGYKKLAAFLDGFWLESYVLSCIHVIRTQSMAPITEAFRAVEVKRRGTYPAAFELDVVAMKGYQLFAISCTTSLIREQNKKRLFEAYTRARQMGGDEARVALVGGFDDTIGLLQEVLEEWMAPRDVIRVFGPQDWPNLEEKLANWFNWQPV